MVGPGVADLGVWVKVARFVKIEMAVMIWRDCNPVRDRRVFPCVPRPILTLAFRQHRRHARAPHG